MKIYLVNGEWTMESNQSGVVAFLWHENQDIDSEGVELCAEDADDPNSMELYVSNRESENETISVIVHENPIILEVESYSKQLCARAAYYLARENKAKVQLTRRSSPQDPQILIARMGDFDLEAALKRTRLNPFFRFLLDNYAQKPPRSL